MKRCIPAIIIVCAMQLSGCVGERSAVPGAVRRDSVGVGIVEYTVEAWRSGPEWKIPADPTVQIGEVSGRPEYLFSGIVGAVRLSDGRIAVANRSSGEIRIYDGAGRYLSAIGRPGEGPGEFRRLGWIAAFEGDSLLAYDSVVRRLSVFDPHGTFTRSVPLGTGSTSNPQIVGWFGDGSMLIAESTGSATLRTGLSANLLAYLRYAPRGTLLDTVATAPGPEQFTRVAQGSMSVTTPPFARFPVASARGVQAFVSVNDRFQVDVIGTDGRLRTRIRREGRPQAVTEEHLEQVLAAVPDENARRAYRAVLAEMPRDRNMPAFSDLVADAAGSVWLREFGLREAFSTWYVLAPDGSPPASVRLPGAFLPMEIGADYVLGVWSDADGVEHVRMYALRRKEARGG